MRISRKARREITLIALLLLSIPLFLMLTFGESGYQSLRTHRIELQRVQQENLRLREEHRRYLEQIEKLKGDPEAIERIARERYNFARPGDIIVELPGSQTAP